MLKTRRSKLDMLSELFIDQIVSEALDVLGKTGVEEVEKIMSSYTVEPLPDDSLKDLMSIMKNDAQRLGINLPPLD